MGRKPKARAEIQQVDIKKNEVLTVYFHTGQPLARGLVQFEARVNEAGQIELFCDEHVLVRPFTKWTSLDGGTE